MKIVIDNRTQWQTRLLRPYVVRVANEEFPGTTLRNTRSRIHVVVQLNRGKGSPYCSGYARYHSSWATVSVPNPAFHGTFPAIDFCHVLAHELAHCRGVKHPDMALHYRRGEYTNQHFAWALTLKPVVAKVARRKPAPDEKRLAKLAAAERQVARYERRLKLTTTVLKRWQRKVRALRRAVDRSNAMGALDVAAEGKPEVEHVSDPSPDRVE